MTLEEQKMTVRRFFEEAWNQQNLNVVDEIFAATVLFNGQSITREALKQALAGRRTAFPDFEAVGRVARMKSGREGRGSVDVQLRPERPAGSCCSPASAGCSSPDR